MATARVLTKTDGMSREEWLQWRRKGIGGSDAAKVLGIVPYANSTPYALWMDKRGMLPPEPEQTPEAAYWGTVLEDVVAKRLSELTGLKLRKRHVLFQHSHASYMLANIDREVVRESGTGVEIKTASAYLTDQWAGDEIPNAYWVQCQHYMAVMGWSQMVIACLLGGQKMVYKTVAKSADFIQQLIDREGAFWGMVQAGVEPPMTRWDEPGRWHPEQKSVELIAADEESTAAVAELRRVKAQIEALEKAESELTAQLKQKIGDAEGIEGLCTWKQNKDSQKVDWERMAKEKFSATEADVLEFTISKPGARVFRLLKQKEEKNNG